MDPNFILKAWPEQGQAAVADVALWRLRPEMQCSLKGPAERPPRSKKGLAHAAQDDWNQIVRAAWERGMMTEVDEDTIPRNNRGHLIVNGAGASARRKSEMVLRWRSKGSSANSSPSMISRRSGQSALRYAAFSATPRGGRPTSGEK